MTATAERFDCPVPWCTSRYHHGPADCSGDVQNVHGVNVGTRIGAWINTEDGGDDRPVVYLGLTGPGERPADHIYLEVDELRDLARAAHQLADDLERGLGYVFRELRGEQR